MAEPIFTPEEKERIRALAAQAVRRYLKGSSPVVFFEHVIRRLVIAYDQRGNRGYPSFTGRVTKWRS